MIDSLGNNRRVRKLRIVAPVARTALRRSWYKCSNGKLQKSSLHQHAISKKTFRTLIFQSESRATSLIFDSCFFCSDRPSTQKYTLSTMYLSSKWFYGNSVWFCCLFKRLTLNFIAQNIATSFVCYTNGINFSPTQFGIGSFHTPLFLMFITYSLYWYRG